MDIISAYREVGTYRGAAVVSGTTHKTVRRVIARHEAGDGMPARAPRGHNYDAVAELVTARVKASAGRISAKRLLPAAQSARYGGSARNFRLWGARSLLVPVSGGDGQARPWRMMISRVYPPALPDLRPALRLAGPARSLDGA
jgi:hypothetical protein